MNTDSRGQPQEVHDQAMPRSAGILTLSAAVLVAAVVAMPGSTREGLQGAQRASPAETMLADEGNWELAMFKAGQRGDWPAVRRVLSKARLDHPDSIRVHLMEGWVAERREEWRTALDAYERATPLAEDDLQRSVIRTSVADIHRRLGDFKSAHLELQRIESVYGSSERCGRALVLLLIDEGKDQEALNVINVLAEKYPGSDRLRRLKQGLERIQAPAPAADTKHRSKSEPGVESRSH